LKSPIAAGARKSTVCGIGEDDEDFEYGKEYVHTPESALAEESKLYPVATGDIWRHWSEGVPTKLRRRVWSPAFTIGNVRHSSRPHNETLELKWERAHRLTALRKNYNLLPSGQYSSQWVGVYRIFIPDATIERLCGPDPTGTLYLGRAGSKRGWSILRTRLMQVAKREHHATRVPLVGFTLLGIFLGWHLIHPLAALDSYSKNVVVKAIIIAELELCNVKMQVSLPDIVECPHYAALDDA
jgi:hypothetical protein